MCNGNEEIRVKTHGGELDLVQWYKDEVIKLRAEVAVLNELVTSMRVANAEEYDPADLAVQVAMLTQERENLIKLLFNEGRV